MSQTNHVDALRILLAKMEETPVLAENHIQALIDKDRARRSAVFTRMMLTGETLGQASDTPSFLTLDEKSFCAYIHGINNELDENVAIISQSFTKYISRGEIPSPHYAWRVAVMLRRAKLNELELRFLAAWCKHFGHISLGSRYAHLNERYIKLIHSR